MTRTEAYYIYRTTNNINGKTYIGQHRYTDIEDGYMGSGKILKKAFKKYGKENFTKEILYKDIHNQETADSVEIYAIAKERSIGKGEYNIADGGYLPGWNKNRKTSPETKAKISKNSARYWKGKHLPESAKLKDSIKHLGEKNGMFGKHHTEECKKKLSMAKGYKVLCVETNKEYSSIRFAAESIGCPYSRLRNHIIGKTENVLNYHFVIIKGGNDGQTK